MGEIAGGGLDEGQVKALLQSMSIGDMGTFTLATLPDPASVSRRTIWVSDLWSGMTDVTRQGGRMVSEGGFWKPLRPLVVNSIPTPAADMTIQPFVQGTTLFLTGATALVKNITLGVGSGFAIPYPGYRQRTTRLATGLLGVVVNGLSLGLNSWADHEWDGTAWRVSASGGLL